MLSRASLSGQFVYQCNLTVDRTVFQRSFVSRPYQKDLKIIEKTGKIRIDSVRDYHCRVTRLRHRSK